MLDVDIFSTPGNKNLCDVSESRQTNLMVDGDIESGVSRVKVVDQARFNPLVTKSTDLPDVPVEKRSCIAVNVGQASNYDQVSNYDQASNCDNEDFEYSIGIASGDVDDLLLVSDFEEAFLDSIDMCTCTKSGVKNPGDWGRPGVMNSGICGIHHSKSGTDQDVGEPEMRLPLPVSAKPEGQLYSESVSEEAAVFKENDSGEWQEVKRKKKRGRRISENSDSYPIHCVGDERLVSNRCFEMLGGIEVRDFEFFLAGYRKYCHKIKRRGDYWLVNVNGDDFAYKTFKKIIRRGFDSFVDSGNRELIQQCFKALSNFSHYSRYMVYISLIAERSYPGFLRVLGDSYLMGLDSIDQLKRYRNERPSVEDISRVFEKVYECRGGISGMGWEGLFIRGRCKLFTILCDSFRRIKRMDLIRDMMQKIDEIWLNDSMCSVLRMIKESKRGDALDKAVYDLQEVTNACFYWLISKFWDFQPPEGSDQFIESFAGTLEVMFSSLDKLNDRELYKRESVKSLLKNTVCKTLSVSSSFCHVLGYDRAIKLFEKILEWSRNGPGFESYVIRLRLTFLSVLLMKCEDLSKLKNKVDFYKTWSEYLDAIQTNIEKCDQYFMSNARLYWSLDGIRNQHRKKCSQLALLLKKSAFCRLKCEVDKNSSISAMEGAEKYVPVLFKELNAQAESNSEDFKYFSEKISIELAKWHLLINESDRVIEILNSSKIVSVSFMLRKAQLFEDVGEYAAAIKTCELCRARISPDKRWGDQYLRADCKIAILWLQLYKSENMKEHLVKAFRLAVDLLRGSYHSASKSGFMLAVGVMLHIAGGMLNANMKFNNFHKEIASLSFLTTDEREINCWEELCRNLYLRHKEQFTSASTIVNAAQAIGRYGSGLDVGKMPFNF